MTEPGHSPSQSAPHPDASKLRWALFFASRGWAVLPLQSVEKGGCTCGNVSCTLPGKHPRTQVGVKDASANFSQISLWWRWWPSSNVGIATGVASGLVALDIDSQNGGDASFAQLRSKLPDAFEDPLEVRTGVEGRQFYFACSDPISSRANILPGIDLKGDGDYVVAPPSLDVNGVPRRFVSNDILLLRPFPQILWDLISAEPQAHAGAQEPSFSPSKSVDSPATAHGEPEINLKTCSGNEPSPAAKGHDAKPAPVSEIQRLARLSPLDYEHEREGAAQRLSIRVTVLDDQVKRVRAAENDGDTKGQGRPISFPEPEPCPHAVDGARLLDASSAALLRHVVMSQEAADATALWVVHTYLMDVLNTSPKLAITSPEKGCGKTTLLDVLSIVTRCPLPTANATPAAIFRVIEIARPTLLIDEADTFLNDKSDLHGILNSGHRRNSAHVVRAVPIGEGYEPRMFSTWAAVAFAMIGRAPETLEDRSIPVALRRRRRDEAIVPFRHNDVDDLRRLASMTARWSRDVTGEIDRAVPVVPDGIHNRQADNWSPLLAIADVAGGEWPERARHAAKALTMVGAGEDQSNNILLLADVRNLFDSRVDGKITTKELIYALVAIEERPWSEWCRGRPITPAALAKLLAPFGIVPVNLKLPGEKVLKGYRREHFEDEFARYLPPPPIVAATPLLHPSDGHNSHVSGPLPGDGGSGCENSENPNNHAPSSGVAASANVASIPFMITHAMKDQLRGRGLSDDQIANLTPQEAHEILNPRAQ